MSIKVISESSLRENVKDTIRLKTRFPASIVTFLAKKLSGSIVAVGPIIMIIALGLH